MMAADPSRKPRSMLMVTGGSDAVVKVWRLLDGQIDFKMTFVGHGSDVTCVKFPRHITTFLASTSLDKTARIWQTVDAKSQYDTIIIDLS